MSTDELLDAVAELQGVVDEEKEHLGGGLHLRLCAATQKVYDYAKALKRKETGGGASDEEEEEEEEESDEDPERERTEDDMELNELTDFWEGNFDFGRPRAVPVSYTHLTLPTIE